MCRGRTCQFIKCICGCGKMVPLDPKCEPTYEADLAELKSLLVEIYPSPSPDEISTMSPKMRRLTYIKWANITAGNWREGWGGQISKSRRER